jgi:hypothetical protein
MRGIEPLTAPYCRPPNKALQRTRISGGWFSWRSVRGGELGR